MAARDGVALAISFVWSSTIVVYKHLIILNASRFARLAINNYKAAITRKRSSDADSVNSTANHRRIEAQAVQQHHESLIAALKGQDVSSLRAQGKFALDLREIMALCAKEADTLSISSPNELNNMNQLALRSKLVKFQEGVRVLKDMLATGKLVLDSKYHQLKTICSFPWKFYYFFFI